MKFNFDFLFLLRPSACLICQSQVSEDDQVCLSCWNRFEARWMRERRYSKTMVHPRNASVRVRYLFDWVPDQDPAISKLLLGLKRGASPLSWPRLAKAFTHHHGITLFQGKGGTQDGGSLLIPVPGSSGSPLIRQDLERLDHAHCWAQSLSQETGASWSSMLIHEGRDRVTESKDGWPKERSSTQPQKRKSRRERAQIRMRLKESRHSQDPRKNLWDRPSIIIVDDIITTGASSLAAGLACESLGSFVEVWALACRRISAKPNGL